MKRDPYFLVIVLGAVIGFLLPIVSLVFWIIYSPITMRYSLRSLMILLAVLPPLAAAIWFGAQVEWPDEACCLPRLPARYPIGSGSAYFWYGIPGSRAHGSSPLPP